jgi:DNA-binding MarR family transcriptional regulator
VSLDRDSVRSLSEQVVRLQRAFGSMRQQLAANRSTSGEGVEWAAYGLLFQLVTNGPRRSSVLAEAACVDPSTVSRQVAQLVKAGLVARQSDPEDGRASLLVATDQGRAAFAAKMEHRAQMFDHVLAGWTPQDVDTLARLLARFNDSFAERRDSLPGFTQHEHIKENA